jgi:ribosomal protein S4
MHYCALNPYKLTKGLRNLFRMAFDKKFFIKRDRLSNIFSKANKKLSKIFNKKKSYYYNILILKKRVRFFFGVISDHFIQDQLLYIYKYKKTVKGLKLTDALARAFEMRLDFLSVRLRYVFSLKSARDFVSAGFLIVNGIRVFDAFKILRLGDIVAPANTISKFLIYKSLYLNFFGEFVAKSGFIKGALSRNLFRYWLYRFRRKLFRKRRKSFRFYFKRRFLGRKFGNFSRFIFINLQFVHRWFFFLSKQKGLFFYDSKCFSNRFLVLFNPNLTKKQSDLIRKLDVVLLSRFTNLGYKTWRNSIKFRSFQVLFRFLSKGLFNIRSLNFIVFLNYWGLSLFRLFKFFEFLVSYTRLYAFLKFVAVLASKRRFIYFDKFNTYFQRLLKLVVLYIFKSTYKKLVDSNFQNYPLLLIRGEEAFLVRFSQVFVNFIVDLKFKVLVTHLYYLQLFISTFKFYLFTSSYNFGTLIKDRFLSVFHLFFYGARFVKRFFFSFKRSVVVKIFLFLKKLRVLSWSFYILFLKIKLRSRTRRKKHISGRGNNRKNIVFNFVRKSKFKRRRFRRKKIKFKRIAIFDFLFKKRRMIRLWSIRLIERIFNLVQFFRFAVRKRLRFYRLRKREFSFFLMGKNYRTRRKFFKKYRRFSALNYIKYTIFRFNLFARIRLYRFNRRKRFSKYRRSFNYFRRFFFNRRRKRRARKKLQGYLLFLFLTNVRFYLLRRYFVLLRRKIYKKRRARHLGFIRRARLVAFVKAKKYAKNQRVIV